jgi:hypothetical protein
MSSECPSGGGAAPEEGIPARSLRFGAARPHYKPFQIEPNPITNQIAYGKLCSGGAPCGALEENGSFKLPHLQFGLFKGWGTTLPERVPPLQGHVYTKATSASAICIQYIYIYIYIYVCVCVCV